MLIEIHGGGFKNKGAELMLATVMRELSVSPDVEFVINPSVHDDSASCRRYGLLQYVPLPKPKGGRLFPFRFAANKVLSSATPANILRKRGYVRYRDVDALIDISGVRFSDAASRISADNFLDLAGYLHAQSKPVILLPQMFGPFNNPNAAKQLQRLGRVASLIVARDERSYGYLASQDVPSEKIMLAPDITIANSGATASSAPASRYGCIVPNARMLDKGDKRWSGVYMERLVLAAKAMLVEDVHPVILTHSLEDGEDQPLAEQLLERINDQRCSIKIADDPLQTKAFIAGATLLVGSRYHSVVSALSSGVPAIVMGWAHKYETLLNDFGVPELIHGVEQDEQDLTGIVRDMLSESMHQKTKAKLLASKEKMLPAVHQMWGRVARQLGLQ